MTTDSKVPDGASVDPDGIPDDKAKQTVSFATYDKSMKALAKSREREKELEEKYNAVELDRKTKEDAKLHEQGEFKKLLEQREKELTDMKSKLTLKEEQEATSRKLNAFLGKLGGKLVSNDFLTFVDVEKIVINPATNEVDESSITAEVSRYVAKYPTTVNFGKHGSLPADAPGPTNSINYDQWLKLPVKEKRKQLTNMIKP